MAKVRRYSGQLKIELSYNDRSDQYRVKLCPTVKREACETVYVKPPRHLTRAVDSPEAYDRTAHAAISFSKDRIQDYADPSNTGSGWYVRRPGRAKRVTVRGKRGLSGIARRKRARR